VYDTMWKSTGMMAQALSEGLVEGGTEVRLMALGQSHRSDVATEMLDAGALLVGSPTLNGQMFPTVADVLTYLRGLQPKPQIAERSVPTAGVARRWIRSISYCRR